MGPIPMIHHHFYVCVRCRETIAASSFLAATCMYRVLRWSPLTRASLTGDHRRCRASSGDRHVHPSWSSSCVPRRSTSCGPVLNPHHASSYILLVCIYIYMHVYVWLVLNFFLHIYIYPAAGVRGRVFCQLAWQCSDLAWWCSGGVRGSCCSSKREADRAARVEMHWVAAARVW